MNTYHNYINNRNKKIIIYGLNIMWCIGMGINFNNVLNKYYQDNKYYHDNRTMDNKLLLNEIIAYIKNKNIRENKKNYNQVLNELLYRKNYNFVINELGFINMNKKYYLLLNTYNNKKVCKRVFSKLSNNINIIKSYNNTLNELKKTDKFQFNLTEINKNYFSLVIKQIQNKNFKVGTEFNNNNDFYNNYIVI